MSDVGVFTVENEDVIGLNGRVSERRLRLNSSQLAQQGYTQSIVYTAAGKQALRQDVQKAYDAVKDNPTAQNVAHALKEQFASTHWWDADDIEHTGDPDKINAVDEAVRKASVNGMIAGDKLQEIADEIERQTSGPVNHHLGLNQDAPSVPSALSQETMREHNDISPAILHRQQEILKRAMDESGPIQLDTPADEVRQFFAGLPPREIEATQGGAIPTAYRPDISAVPAAAGPSIDTAGPRTATPVM